MNREGWVTPDAGSRPTPPIRARTPVAERIDEAARLIHASTRARLLIALVCGAAACFIIAPDAALGFLLLAPPIEAWAYVATRPLLTRQTATPRARRAAILPYLLVNAWWLTFAGVQVLHGGATGLTCALIIVAVAAGLAPALFHTSPAAFAATACAPLAVALFMAATHGGAIHWGPVCADLAAAEIFVFGRAVGTPSAQQQDRWVRASLENYATLADRIPDVIARFDFDGAWVYASPAARTVLGHDPEALLGQSLDSIVHPDSLPLIEAAVHVCRQGGAPEPATVRVRRADGRWSWIQTSLALFSNPGVPDSIVCVGRDVTQQMEAEAALRAAKSEAEAANAARADFVANVSHEIRTPMNGVLGVLHLLEGEPVSEEGRALLRQAQASGSMLNQILNDVLDLSRIEAGLLEIAPEPTDPSEVAESVAAMLEGEARAKGLAFVCEAEAGMRVLIDPVRLRQILFNLVGNAVKFTDAGRVTVRLSATPDGPGDLRLKFEVADTGIGVPEAARAHLFERFRQAESDTTRRFGGSGLGLAISRALADMMGGEIGFTSAVGEGSTFWFACVAPVETARAKPEPVPALLDGTRILVVDDNAMNRLVARTMLSRLGASVTEAGDGAAAVDAVKASAFDVVLMDIQMPVMDGVRATRTILSSPDIACPPPIIGMTANVMSHQRESYLAAGMRGVVAKPISPGALLREVALAIAEPATSGPDETEEVAGA